MVTVMCPRDSDAKRSFACIRDAFVSPCGCTRQIDLIGVSDDFERLGRMLIIMELLSMEIRRPFTSDVKRVSLNSQYRLHAKAANALATRLEYREVEMRMS